MKGRVKNRHGVGVRAKVEVESDLSWTESELESEP